MTHHLPHLLMIGFPFVLFVLFFAVEWRRTSDQPLSAPLWVAAGASTGSSVIHAVVTPHHLHQAALLGWFFALLSLAQLGWVVVLLLRPTRSVVVLGVVGNLGVVALWAWTRSVGIPFGIEGGVRQRVGALDVASTVLEVGVVLAGLAWVRATSLPNGQRPVQLGTLPSRNAVGPSWASSLR